MNCPTCGSLMQRQFRGNTSSGYQCLQAAADHARARIELDRSFADHCRMVIVPNSTVNTPVESALSEASP